MDYGYLTQKFRLNLCGAEKRLSTLETRSACSVYLGFPIEIPSREIARDYRDCNCAQVKFNCVGNTSHLYSFLGWFVYIFFQSKPFGLFIDDFTDLIV